jgi:UDP-glucuronate decarboxylase
MRSILVTGGAGFLGSHLCERLLERGDNVICLDNFFTGRKQNVTHLLANPRFELIRHDIVQPIALEADQIYNLACPASPVAYQYNPIKTIKTSTVGVVNVLGLAKRCKARILHASTSEVYGDPTVHPQPESYWGNVNPLGPRSCYDEGKRVAESLCMNYHQEHNLEVRIIRIFNTYGPRMDPNDGRVISNFITQALRGEPLTIYGNGLQTRSFCYVDDLLRGMMLLMDQDKETGPVNIGNPGEYTMLQLAEQILKQIPESKSKIVHKPLPQDDPKQRCPDITKARSLLGWSPTVDLQAGLAKTTRRYLPEHDIRRFDTFNWSDRHDDTQRNYPRRGIGNSTASVHSSRQQATHAGVRQADGLLSAVDNDAGRDPRDHGNQHPAGSSFVSSTARRWE